ncbi:unnamed protein product [Kuraishia capsulata CBS 1993]|uniref:Uncharacterized protein n=1 Tax=Kuraishia capsulata CBS 1993 TaxID=1382522 RepID=W6MG54_9ASCO|nr:uncharacterized protein KUCA_T00000677001 [Kuraishia capsulata CBS 1993]CDK24711.1 unnamed protein product [Kuraishia capsulata CBS 1993]
MITEIIEWGCPEYSRCSLVLGYVSSLAWLVAQVPQQITNYKTKSVDGVSVGLLVLWFMGDLLSFIGCILTHQLPFQYYLALYFIYNDLVLCGQWYYYTYRYKAHHRVRIEKLQGLPIDSEESSCNETSSLIERNPGSDIQSTGQSRLSKARSPNMAKIMAASASLISNAHALPIPKNASFPVSSYAEYDTVGRFFAWSCTCVYLASRIPQLYKNWQRKSVSGISPLLFAAALVGNLCYTGSILSSCDFMFADDGRAFVMKELPYILGSSGTIIFDLFYFYQRWMYGEHEGQIFSDDAVESIVGQSS